MTTTDHYHSAEDALKRGARASHLDLARAQLHALLVIADELRDVRNELTEIRAILARPA